MSKPYILVGSTPAQHCPECEAFVPTSDQPIKGEIYKCPDCGEELELVSINPMTFHVAPPEKEDWGE